MDRESKMIHSEMEQTRVALAEKLETLERKVTGTVQDATEIVQDATEIVQDAAAAVSDTVGSVQDAVQETVATVKETVQDTVGSVKQAFDLGRQVDRHPWLLFGGAVTVGFCGERLLGGGQPSATTSAASATAALSGLASDGSASVSGAAARNVAGNGRRTDHGNVMAYLSARQASKGKCSQTCTPGRRVAIGRNSPRISAGASGFMSNMSIWLGAPVRKTIMTERACRRSVAAAATPPPSTEESPSPSKPE